ncbi:Thioredoxin-disulfide reductase [Bertholletia excelsa]
MDKVTRLALENGVVIFSKSTCCLCYTVDVLFQEIGVKPLVHEIDQDPDGREMEQALMSLGCRSPVPTVFIGGKLVGSINEVMSLHLDGSLIPLLQPYPEAQNA